MPDAVAYWEISKTGFESRSQLAGRVSRLVRRSSKSAGGRGNPPAGAAGTAHPELVADRLVRFAQVVGRDNVIASTDCGLGGRLHPQLAWAKLGALAEGARLASKELWG